MFSEEEIAMFRNNKDFIAECVHKKGFIESMLKIAASDDGGSALDDVLRKLGYIKNCICAQRQMSDIGYADVLPDCVSGLRPG